LPQYGTGMHTGAVLELHVMIQFRTRVFPTTGRLARIHAMPQRSPIIAMRAVGMCLNVKNMYCLNACVGSATAVVLGKQPRVYGFRYLPKRYNYHAFMWCPLFPYGAIQFT
jgi:hypothetical protein